MYLPITPTFLVKESKLRPPPKKKTQNRNLKNTFKIVHKILAKISDKQFGKELHGGARQKLDILQEIGYFFIPKLIQHKYS